MNESQKKLKGRRNKRKYSSGITTIQKGEFYLFILFYYGNKSYQKSLRRRKFLISFSEQKRNEGKGGRRRKATLIENVQEFPYQI